MSAVRTFEHNGRQLTATAAVVGSTDEPELAVEIHDGTALVAQLQEAADVETIIDWFKEVDQAA